MSRTPLFRTLRRSYRAASYAITRVEPLDEVLDRRESASDLAAGERRVGITRREFVAGTAAAAAVAALDGCASARPPAVSAQPPDGGPPVLIVGAGVAGLNAGYRLRQAGVHVRITEAQMEGGCGTGERAPRAIAERRRKRVGDARRPAPRRLMATRA